MAPNPTPPKWEAINPRPRPVPASPPEARPLWRTPDSPPPTPGFQARLEGRLDLARFLLERHTRLGALRSLVALSLALADILLMALALGVYFHVSPLVPASSWLLRLLILLFVLGSAFCLLAALLLALRAALWCRGVGLPAIRLRYYFQSGAALPLPDLEQFEAEYRAAARDSLLSAVIAEVHACARRRQCQETRFRRAVIATLAALLFFGLQVLSLALFV